jgi:competence protein ComEC
LLVGAALGCGDLIAPVGWPPCGAAALLSVVARLAARRTTTACLSVTLSLLGAQLAASETLRFERARSGLFTRGATVWEGHFVGRLLGPVEREPGGDRILLLQGRPEGRDGGKELRIRLRTPPSEIAARPGARLRIWCRLRPAGESRPLHAFGRIKSARLIERIGREAGWFGGLREAAARRLRRATGEGPAAELVQAMTLGRRAGIDRGTRRSLRDAGLLHLVAISGLHVGLILVGLLALAARCGLPHRLRAGLLLLLLGSFVPFVGGRPSVLRASIAGGVLIAGRTTGREGEPLNGLAIVAALLVACRPSLISAPAFQLTFLATVSILLHPGRLLTIAGAAYLGTAPAVAWHFGHLAPIGALSTLAATPLAALVLLGGYGALVLVPGSLLAGACGWLAGRSAGWLLTLAGIVESVPPGAFVVERPAAPILAAYYGCLLLPSVTPGVRPRWRRALLAGLLLAVHLGGPPRAPGGVEATLLDVGQGLAVAVATPDGRQLLVDAGGARSASFDPGERIVVPHLLSAGGRSVTALVVSHQDLDHAGGAFAVLRELQVGALWVGPGYHRSPRLLRLVGLAHERGAAVRLAHAGLRTEIGGLPLEVLAPERDARSGDNDRSIVVRLGIEPCRLLLPGDLEQAGERGLVARDLDLSAEALVLSHHGSRTGSSRAFLERVAPRWALVSAGTGNPFGHPHGETLGRVGAQGISLLRTDLQGAVTLIAEPRGWRDGSLSPRTGASTRTTARRPRRAAGRRACDPSRVASPRRAAADGGPASRAGSAARRRRRGTARRARSGSG